MNLSSQFDNAVYFVDLASVSDPALVAGEIAASVGLIQYAGELTLGLVDFLRDKRLVLLLDNCEHVIGEAAAVTERLIQDTKSVHILVTSREPLQVEGERVQRLFPLEYPRRRSNANGGRGDRISRCAIFCRARERRHRRFRVRRLQRAACRADLPSVGWRRAGDRTGGRRRRGLWAARHGRAIEQPVHAAAARQDGRRRRGIRRYGRCWIGAIPCFPTSSAWLSAG